MCCHSPHHSSGRYLHRTVTKSNGDDRVLINIILSRSSLANWNLLDCETRLGSVSAIYLNVLLLPIHTTLPNLKGVEIVNFRVTILVSSSIKTKGNSEYTLLGDMLKEFQVLAKSSSILTPSWGGTGLTIDPLYYSFQAL